MLSWNVQSSFFFTIYIYLDFFKFQGNIIYLELPHVLSPIGRCDQECGYLNVTLVESPDDLPQDEEVDVFCRMRTYEGYCIFYYTLSRTPSGRDSIVVRPKGCSRK